MPFNYCQLDDVKAELLGLDVSDMPATLIDRITDDYIPMMTQEIDTYCSENFNLTRVREFYDGTDLPYLALRHKNIRQIDNVTIRIVPSMQWFFFQRWYYIKTTAHDGTIVAPDGGVEPVHPPYQPKFDTPYTYATGVPLTPNVISGNTANFSNSTDQYERSDLHVDSVNGLLIIPPRVLFIEAQGVPFWNYTWLRGQRNIEVGYWYGYQDYAHLPATIKHAAAKLVAAHVLQKKAMWVSSGTKSISQDNVSKSFGEGAYSTEIKAFREEAFKTLDRYKRIMV
jgi:hypothetical protein